MELRFSDARRFGRFWLLRAGEEDTYSGIGELGLEPAVASQRTYTLYIMSKCAKPVYIVQEAKFLIAWAFSGPGGPDNSNSVEELYLKYKRLMFATAGKYTENSADQEDIVQTALERLIKIFSVSGPQGRCISAAYIVTTVRSVSIEFLRRQGLETKYFVSMEGEQYEQAVGTTETMDKLMMLSEDASQLWAIWPQLPDEDRILLEGKYILEYSDQELAVILKCKPNSIRMKLTRARRRALKLLPERKTL